MKRMVERLLVAMTATPRRCWISVIAGGLVWLGVIVLMSLASDGTPRLPWQAPRQPLTALGALLMFILGAFMLGYVGFIGWRNAAKAEQTRTHDDGLQAKDENP